MSSTPQHMAALENAHRVRRDHREIRRGLAGGDLSLAAAFDDPRAQRMTVWNLLIAQCGWGPDRVRKELVAAGRALWPLALDPPPVEGSAFVGELLERERTALLRACGRRS